MAIQNLEQLKGAAAEAGRLIQEINDASGESFFTDYHARVRFPYGFIRTAHYHRDKLRFVKDPVLRSNLSYAIMTHDVLRWLATRTTLTGQAKEMLIKEAICIIGSVCESITIFKGEHGVGRTKSFSARVQHLCEQGVIDQKLKNECEWVWEIRRREHLTDVPFKEWDHYEMRDWRRAVATYRKLREALQHWQANMPPKGVSGR